MGAAVGLLPRRRVNLRQRPARALPEWDEADPLYPYVLGLYAFGLEENNLYPQAEEAGRRAVASDAARAVGAARGGARDGDAGPLRRGRGLAAPAPAQMGRRQRFAGHLWWHLALFRLEALDDAGVLRWSTRI